jgi:hypothetical protein
LEAKGKQKLHDGRALEAGNWFTEVTGIAQATPAALFERSGLAAWPRIKTPGPHDEDYHRP